MQTEGAYSTWKTKNPGSWNSRKAHHFIRVDAHSTQGMYVKRMLLTNRRNLWQLAAPSPCCFCMPILFQVWALYWGLSIPFVFTMTRRLPFCVQNQPKRSG